MKIKFVYKEIKLLVSKGYNLDQIHKAILELDPKITIRRFYDLVELAIQELEE